MVIRGKDSDGNFEFAFGGKNVIDVARMGKMHKIIRHPIIQSDLQATFYGAFLPYQFLKMTMVWYFLSLFTFGLAAPFCLNYRKRLMYHAGFKDDMKSVFKKGNVKPRSHITYLWDISGVVSRATKNVH